MFGIVVSGRPVLTEALTPSPGKFAFQIPSNPPFSSIAVFLLPGATLPADQAAAIYVQVPPSADFKLVGAIANEKQSAIIKVRTSAAAVNGVVDQDDMIDDGAPAPAGDVVVGLSVEPAALIAQQLEDVKRRAAAVPSATGASNALVRSSSSPVPRVTAKVLAKRIIGDAFNYLASFEGSDGKVPMKTFQDWWKKFEKKVDMDPSFLEKTDEGA